MQPVDDLELGGELTEVREGVQRDLIRGSLWTLLSAAVVTPVTFLVNLLVVRALGVEQYAHFALYTAIYAVASLVADAGCKSATIMWLPKERTSADGAEARLLRRSSGFHLFVEAPVLGLVTLVMLWSTGAIAVVVAVAAVMLTQVGTMAQIYLIGSRQNALAARIALPTSLAVQATIAVAAASNGTGAVTWASQAAAGLIAPAAALALVSRRARREILRPAIPIGWPAGFVQTAVSTGVASLLGLLVFGRTEVFVLRLHGDLRAIAVFSLAAGLAGQLTVPMDSLLGPLLPASADIVASNPRKVHAALTKSMRVSAVLGAITVAAAAPLGVALVAPLYGSGFRQAGVVFALLGAVSCTQSALHPANFFFYALGGARSMLRINLVSMLLDVGLAFGLIPVIGIWGAAAANASAQLLSLGLTLAGVARRSGLSLLSLLKASAPLAVAFVGTACATAIIVHLHSAALSAVVGVTVGLGVLLVTFAAAASLRLQSAEAASIESHLPGPMRKMWRTLSAATFLVNRRAASVVTGGQ